MTSDTTMETNLFFVYGSLKRGYWNNRWLGDAEFVTEAISYKEFLMVAQGVPFILGEEQLPEQYHRFLAPVEGEVWKGDEETMKQLDLLESNGVMYDRFLMETRCGLTCYAYKSVDEWPMYRLPLAPITPMGTWKWKDN